MSDRHKAASQSRPRYPTTDPSSPRDVEKLPAPKTPPGYVLEWNAYTSRRRNIADVRELRAELLRETQHLGSPVVGEERRLVVVSGGGLCDAGLVEALRAAGGVEAGLLECHRERRGYRGRSRVRGRVGGWWWSWEFPEGEGLGRGRCFGRVSLWRGANVSILILPDRVPSADSVRGRPSPLPPPPLKHQDAMTNASALRQHYGTVDDCPPLSPTSPQTETIETAIWDSLGDGVPLEEILGDLVYERWVRLFERLTPSKGLNGLEEDVTRALEVNMDCARILEKQGRSLSSVSLKDWEDLLSRAHRRILVSSTTSSSKQSRDEDEDREEEKRSLDRISYLGGILLPVTVVSGVLAIEGDYGPEGGNFWVFWVASLVASVLTILVIHIDRVRTLQVWMEVAADSVLEAGLTAQSEQEKQKKPSEVLVRRFKKGEEEDEEEVKAYRRKRLGWGGAVKQVSGYYRWRGRPGMEFHIPRDWEL